MAVLGQGTGSQSQLLLRGTTGQRQVVQVSRNLFDWTPLATNSSGTNLFQVIESNPLRFPQRFYRAVVIP